GIRVSPLKNVIYPKRTIWIVSPRLPRYWWPKATCWKPTCKRCWSRHHTATVCSPAKCQRPGRSGGEEVAEVRSAIPLRRPWENEGKRDTAREIRARAPSNHRAECNGLAEQPRASDGCQRERS